MSDELTREEEEQLEAILDGFQDDAEFCRESLTILDMNGQLVPMEHNPAQKLLNDTIKEIRRRGRPVRIVVLKERRAGFSTGVAAKFYKETVFWDGQKTLVVAQDGKAVKESLFPMYDRFQRTYRPFRGVVGQPRLVSDRKDGFDWGNESSITIQTAKNLEGARSFGFRRVHLSEFAFYPNPEQLMTALMQCVPYDPDTMVIVESTANGIGGAFYELCKEARDPKKKSDWVFIFFPWHADPKCRMPLSVPADRFFDGLSKEELETEKSLMRRFDLQLEQLQWRRWCIANNCKGDPRTFQQEYPGDPDEAFLVSGRPQFNPNDVQTQKEFITDGTAGGLQKIVEPTRDLIIFNPRERGELTVFKRPQKNAQYAIGADPCAGIDINEGVGSPDPDFACAHVYDIDTGEMVARLSERITAGEFGAYLCLLGEWYNFAFIVPEINKDGGATVDRMLVLGYPRGRIYHRRQNARDGNSQVLRVGWKTDTITRPQLVSKIDTALRERSIFLRHHISVQQLFTFVIYPDGIGRAQKGCHDDDVIACGLGSVGIQEAPRVPAMAASKKQLAVQYAPSKRDQLRKEYYGDKKRDDDGWDD